MVNLYRLQIIEILKTGITVSGEYMAEKLGISRVAVWKHINCLEKSGYEIESSKSGYRMTVESDTPIPEAFGSEGVNINHLLSTGSTMTEARNAAFAGCPAGTVFTADTQTAGCGRRGRGWLSEKGGLYFTLITRPDSSPMSAYSSTLTAAACLCRILNENFQLPARFKWPNDIYIENRKAAGILEEFFVNGDSLQFVNLGIGINVHNNPCFKSAVSLDSAAGRKLSRKNILKVFLQEFENRGKNLNDNLKMLNSYSILKNRQVRCRGVRTAVVSGTAADITEKGGLKIITPDRKHHFLEFGDEINIDF